MFNILVVCVLLCVSQNFEYAKAQASLPCVAISNCPVILDLFDDPSQQERANALLTKHRCGRDGNLPKVRCPNACQTPDEYAGFCEPINDCPLLGRVATLIHQKSPLVEMIPKNYIHKFVCSKRGEPLSVCCPIDEDRFERNLNSWSNLFPDPKKYECGAIEEDKITKGQAADLTDFPWTALLHYDSDPDNTIVRCAGSLINNKYILTAAHCVDGLSERLHGKLDRVTLGEYDVNSKRDCIGRTCADPVVVVQVENIIEHPERKRNHQHGLIDNDIALIRLAEPVEFTTYIKPICLPAANSQIPDMKSLAITGWGITETGNTSPTKLKATVQVTNKYYCQQDYRSKSITVGDGIFCAAGRDGVDSCGGDSGGPIMLREKLGRFDYFSLAGVVSFGSTNCGKDELPGLYTDTAKYIDWIRETVRP